MAIIALVLGMFSMDTQEFRETANKQMKEGYEWVYVGKTKPSGVPAITMKANGEEYILNLIFSTRNPSEYNLEDLSHLIENGASPRASISLILASKARAFLEGRGYITPEDVRFIGKDVLRHRIILSYEAEAEEISSEEIIQRLFDSIEIP